MTIHVGAREYVIRCDSSGCFREDVHHCYSKMDAMSVFREKGWSIGREKCYCEYHKFKRNRGIE